MEIGVIGMNEYARNLCRHWVRNGHKIFIADLHLSPGGYAFAEELGQGASLDNPQKVARQAEVLVLAVPLKHLQPTLESLHVQHKIVIDMVVETPSNAGAAENSFQMIRQALPDAKVVKVTSRYPWYLLHIDSSDAEILYSYSDDDLAQRMVRVYIDGSGYRMIDLKMRKPKE
jgi:predicted dinucleotide-binding enzyme